MRSGIVVMQVSRLNCKLMSFQSEYFESPTARSLCRTGISQVLRAKLFPSTGMKVLRSLHCSIASTMCRR